MKNSRFIYPKLLTYETSFFKPKLGYATDYFVISKRKGWEWNALLDGICKENIKILRCDVHIRDVHGSWRQASKTCTQWSHKLFLDLRAPEVNFRAWYFLPNHNKFARAPEVALRTWFFSTYHVVLFFLETISMLDLFEGSESSLQKRCCHCGFFTKFLAPLCCAFSRNDVSSLSAGLVPFNL